MDDWEQHIDWSASVEPLRLKSTDILRFGIYRSHRKPLAVQFWFSDGEGIELTSEPIEVNERTEAGLLVVSNPSDREFEIFQLPRDHWINSSRTISVLVHSCPSVKVDSGILICSQGKRAIITAGAMPCTLAIAGDLKILPSDFEPEYDCEHYTKRIWGEELI